MVSLGFVSRNLARRFPCVAAIYRGCWHGVSRDLFCNCVIIFLAYTTFTTNSAFIGHALWLDQACAHCPRFLTAAAKKRLGRVSVPVWLIVLSDQLRISGLVELLTHQLPNPAQAHPQGVSFRARHQHLWLVYQQL